jgi:nucleoid DNA-binding protein
MLSILFAPSVTTKRLGAWWPVLALTRVETHFAAPRCLTTYPGKDIRFRVGRRKSSGQYFKVFLFTLSDASNRAAVNSNRPINLGGFGSHWVDRRRDARNPLPNAQGTIPERDVIEFGADREKFSKDAGGAPVGETGSQLGLKQLPLWRRALGQQGCQRQNRQL